MRRPFTIWLNQVSYAGTGAASLPDVRDIASEMLGKLTVRKAIRTVSIIKSAYKTLSNLGFVHVRNLQI